MQLVPELSKKIINEVQRVISEDVIVINPSGTIIASTDEMRVDSFHEGAVIVMETKKKLYITEEKAEKLIGVKPGINLPIFFEHDVIGVIGITGIPSNVEPFAEIIRRMTELIIREAAYMEKKEWEQRGLESFFYEWIYTNSMDQAFIDRGHILGVNITIPYLCLLLQVDQELSPEEYKKIQTKISTWFDSNFASNKNDFLLRWGHGRFILFKDTRHSKSSKLIKQELEALRLDFITNYQISISIGGGKSIESVQKSYQEAGKALKVAQKRNRVVCYDDLLLDIVLEEVTEETREVFLDRVISSIRNDAELLITLKTLFSNNHSLKKTADGLHIHINTLHYRLKQIKDLTGINPKCAEGITMFYLALSFLDEDKHMKIK
ncbi:CdaR family transcriptional regulator [Metabacillus idriensis]|uniref:CdaR family transcriptional regulator n=1 Tax=Metabacillus idriensis TaxID=324768 RepID=UPI00174CFE52|nr:sugar diacid recognition domain-containing protein [Metabacillus idriensis]